MAKLKHVSHRGDGASFGGDDAVLLDHRSAKSAKSRSSRRQQKTHLLPASPTRSPSTYRAKDEVVEELSVLARCGRSPTATRRSIP